MSSEANKALVRHFLQVVEQGDLEAAAEMLSPTLKVHLAGAPSALDRASFMQFGKMWHGAFPDEQSTIEDQIAERDTVVTRLAATATQTGAFQGLPATGKQIRVTAIWIDRIADGKIVERWSQFDQLGVMQQLGLIPMPEQTAA